MNNQNDSNPEISLINLEKIKAIHARIQEDIETALKSNDTEDHMDTALYGTLSMICTHFFVRHGFSANTVTLLSLLFGVCGSVFFYAHNIFINLAGIIIEYFAVVLDCSDGQVARLTGTSSQLGRFLDGMVDSVNFIAIYFVLGLRMMREPIPFVHARWSFWIWLVLAVSGYCHAEQARMADYYRTLHLHFLNHDSLSRFTRTRNIKEEIAQSKSTPFYNRLYLRIYYMYTWAQEHMSPNMNKFLSALENNSDVIPVEISEVYLAKSRKYVQLTNVLTFNPRAYTLYILLLLRLHPFFFPVNIIIFGGMMIFMVTRYEKIAKEMYESAFTDL